MRSFSEWLNEQGGISVPGIPNQAQQTYGQHKASKEEIVQYWSALQVNAQIPMTPIPADHKGSTYSQDAIRITGTQAFIDGVLARLKDLMTYESPETKLDLVYRRIESKSSDYGRQDAYVFYIMARQKPPKKMRIKKPSTQNQLEITPQPKLS